MTRTRPITLPMWALFLGGLPIACGHAQASPAAPGSPQAISPGDGVAVQTVAGVRCSASADAWRGTPVNLASEVIPLGVMIENHSGRPLRLVYESFKLVGGSGGQFYPLPLLPPTNDHGKAASLPVQPTYRPAGFFVAPRFSGAYTTVPAWPTHLRRDESLYRLSYREWSDDLPTSDLLAKGLPEGVLEDGGSISGFLYFERDARAAGDLLFQADLTEVGTGRQVAQINIPSRIE